MAVLQPTEPQFFADALRKMAEQIEAGEIGVEEMVEKPEFRPGIPVDGFRTHHLTGRKMLELVLYDKRTGTSAVSGS